jgi:nucleoside-diphosphate-sugar epimerase
MPNNTILTTGAAGFIGFHVAQRLLSDGRRSLASTASTITTIRN